MSAFAISVPYVLFVWWFSTGAVLILVGLSSRQSNWAKLGTVVLFVASLAGLATSSQVASAAGAYCVFTCAILLWGAVEISLLSGWITGSRPEACPAGCGPLDRMWFALQAIAYHEFVLIVTAALVFAVSLDAPNQLGWWTFAALLVLRQSAKINLFLGVRTLNDELLPAQVEFLRSYFARKPINALFPFSVTLSTAAAAGLAVSAGRADSAFDALCYALIAALVALGALEHWFMVLPVPVVDIWRWSARSETSPAQAPSEPILRPAVALVPADIPRTEKPVAKSPAQAARLRLEDQFRQAYAARQAVLALAQNDTTNEIKRTAEGNAP